MRVYLGRVVLALALGLAAGHSGALAQTAFEDAGGNSSIFIRDGGFARVNVTDSSVKTGYVFDFTDKDYFFGIELSGKLSGKFASIFESGKPSPEGRIRGTVGWKFLLSDPPKGEPTKGPLTDDWLTLHVGYRRASYRLLAENENFASQIKKRPFDGFEAILAYNALFRSKRGPVLLGVSGGAERRNNIGDLSEVEVEDQVFTSSSGTTQRSVLSKQKAFRGEFAESTAAPINTDLVWFPARFRSEIGFNFFTRSNVGGGDRHIEPGVGVFVTKAGQPTKVIGGLSLSARDGKARFGLIAGYNF
jgi:hypothetical protein